MKYFGFLTVTENSRHGLIGGYLVLNHIGRPAEFHCTLPVRANRAQEILYGVTLQSYLYGELIAQTLIQKAKIKPATVLTNLLQVLEVQKFVDIPVVCVAGDDSVKNFQLFDPETHQSHNQAGKQESGDHLTQIAEIPGFDSNQLTKCRVGRYELAVPELASRSSGETEKDLMEIVQTIDFLEPFERIRLAVEEAQKAA